jgi:transcriptional regulator with XRE-family HTH domain
MTATAYKAERERNLRRFGANVRSLRIANGLSQEALAELTRLHRTAIGKIELGGLEPRLTTLVILADGLGVRIDDLVAGLRLPAERRPPPQAQRRR